MENVRTVVFYKNHFKVFYDRQKPKVREKIDWTLSMISLLPRVPKEYLKHLEGTDGLYEIRIHYGSDIFRVFCCFDAGKLIILLNGFQKKTQRTPTKEIEKAIIIKKEYENER